MAVVDAPAEHGHPGFDVGICVGDGGFAELFEIAIGTVFEDHGNILVFSAEDVVHGDEGGMREFLEVLDFTYCVDIQAELSL